MYGCLWISNFFASCIHKKIFSETGHTKMLFNSRHFPRALRAVKKGILKATHTLINDFLKAAKNVTKKSVESCQLQLFS
jgi:hypothetical protein